jgi:hypothetical protein
VLEAIIRDSLFDRFGRCRDIECREIDPAGDNNDDQDGEYGKQYTDHDALLLALFGP